MPAQTCIAPAREEYTFASQDAMVVDSPAMPAVEKFDFKNPRALSRSDAAGLRTLHEEWANRLSPRLKSHLRQECALELTEVFTLNCEALAAKWKQSSAVGIFKIEPLRGVAFVHIDEPLCGAVLDRLMGGTGISADSTEDRELTPIEQALFEQTCRVMLDEWCGCWPNESHLKASLLAIEKSGSAITELASAGTLMLCAEIRIQTPNQEGLLHVALPLASLKKLLKTESASFATTGAQPATARTKAATNFTPRIATLPRHELFAELPVTLTAEWSDIELSATQVLGLKPGSVLRMAGPQAGKVSIRLGDKSCFTGRPGTLNGDWAVELTGSLSGPDQAGNTSFS